VHPSDAVVAAYVDRQLAASDDAAVRAHLAECAACVRRMRQLEAAVREVDELLHRLDHPVPQVDVGLLLARDRSRRAHRLGPLAAGIAVACVAAAAAAAVPSTPLYRALERAVEAIRGTDSEAPAPPAPRPIRIRQQYSGGVALVPGRELEVVFRQSQEQGEIHLAFVDGAQASVRGSDRDAAYAVREDRILVDNAHSRASYELTVPRTLRDMRIRVGESVVFQKRGGEVTSVAQPDSTGTYAIPLTPSTRRTP
jgi:anti-sigma factor RsiW